MAAALSCLFSLVVEDSPVYIPSSQDKSFWSGWVVMVRHTEQVLVPGAHGSLLGKLLWPWIETGWEEVGGGEGVGEQTEPFHWTI